MSHNSKHLNILDQIDSITSPRNMSQETALEWLENLSSDIQARIDGLKSDIKNQEGEE